MSSTDPSQPPSGTEHWTASLDALRQRQQELVNRLTQVQKQAAQPLPTKTTAPTATTVQALQAKLTDQVGKVALKVTAVRQTPKTSFGDVLKQGLAGVARGDLVAAQGNLTAARDELHQLQGAIGIASAQIEAQRNEAEARRAELEARAKAAANEVQAYDDATRSMRDLIHAVRQNLEEIQQAHDQVASKIWS